MDKKKVLIVTQDFYPNQSPRSFRATELAKEFCLQNHLVTIMVPEKDGINQLIHQYGMQYIGLERFDWKPISFKRLGIIGTLLGKVVNFGLLHFFEYPTILCIPVIKKALESMNKHQFDLLITIASPHPIHWAVARIWKKYGLNNLAKVWVADCGDPYIGNPALIFKKPFYFKRIEKDWCNKADFISIPIKEAKNAYISDFHSKIRIIPQGFKLSDYTFKVESKKNLTPTFAYAGEFYKQIRDPRPFLDFLVTLELEYKFFIFTSSIDLVKKYESLSNGRIEVSDFIPRNEVLRFLATVDFLINFENLSSLQKPSKLIDYLILQKPVLSVETVNFNRNHFFEFISGDYKNGMNLGDVSDYNIENVATKFLNLINEKLSNGNQ